MLALLAHLPGVDVATLRPIVLTLRDESATPRPSEPQPSAMSSKNPQVVSTPAAGPVRGEGQRIGLVGCVKSKQDAAAPAQDLYTSALFRGRRKFVEASCGRWFILSALHGLVEPDAIIEPYDVTLLSASQAERRAWARRVVEALERELGALHTYTFEIHAGAAYRDHGLTEGLRARGASVDVPVQHLSQGEQLAFYARPADGTDSGVAGAPSPILPTVDELVGALLDPSRRESAADFPRDRVVADQPGLYCWWPDDEGLRQLSAPFGELLALPVYGGQAGASSQATLRSRIRGNHLRGNSSGSTLRRTLAAILFESLQVRIEAPGTLDAPSEERLTDWMLQHLSVSTVAFDDRHGLAGVEGAVLQRLDPPLNLSKVPSTPTRLRLTSLRRRLDRIDA